MKRERKREAGKKGKERGKKKVRNEQSPKKRNNWSTFSVMAAEKLIQRLKTTFFGENVGIEA